MDGIKEQIVKKPFTSQDKMKTYAVLAAALVLAIIAFEVVTLFLGSSMVIIAGALAGAILVGGYYLTGEFQIEYEYCVSGRELIVDKIINQKRRKSFCSFDLKSVSVFEKEPKHDYNTTVYDASGEGEKYALTFKDEHGTENVLIFTPDEKILGSIKPYLPRMI